MDFGSKQSKKRPPEVKFWWRRELATEGGEANIVWIFAAEVGEIRVDYTVAAEGGEVRVDYRFAAGNCEGLFEETSGEGRFDYAGGEARFLSSVNKLL